MTWSHNSLKYIIAPFQYYSAHSNMKYSGIFLCRDCCRCFWLSVLFIHNVSTPCNCSRRAVAEPSPQLFNPWPTSSSGSFTKTHCVGMVFTAAFIIQFGWPEAAQQLALCQNSDFWELQYWEVKSVSGHSRLSLQRNDWLSVMRMIWWCVVWNMCCRWIWRRSGRWTSPVWSSVLSTVSCRSGRPGQSVHRPAV